MSGNLTLALILLFCGASTWLVSRRQAASMAKDLATHALRPNRNPRLDPIWNERQIVIALRVFASVALVLGLYELCAALAG